MASQSDLYLAEVRASMRDLLAAAAAPPVQVPGRTLLREAAEKAVRDFRVLDEWLADGAPAPEDWTTYHYQGDEA